MSWRESTSCTQRSVWLPQVKLLGSLSATLHTLGLLCLFLLLARGPPCLSFGPPKAKVWSRSFRNPVLSLQVDWEPSTQRTVSLVWHPAPLTRPTPTPWPPLLKTPCSPMLARPAMEECGGRASTPLQLGSHSRTGTAKPGSKVTSARAAEDL